ncbi:hypothetical protein V3C99_003903 [Haemonchus contortus]
MGRKFLGGGSTSRSTSKERTTTTASSSKPQSATSVSKSRGRSFTPSASTGRTPAISASRTESKFDDVQVPEAAQPGVPGARQATTKKKEPRRGVVYHPLKPDRDVHYPGYSKSGTDSLEDRKRRSSLSDEYKAKAYREAEKQKEKFAHTTADAYSPEYDILMILVTGVLIVLVVVAIFSVETAPVEEPEDEPAIFDISYSQMAMVTENIDCSIHMKHTALYTTSAQAAIRQGMECLSTMVPSSADGLNSTLSIMVYRRKRDRAIHRELYKDGGTNIAQSTKNDSKIYYSLEDFRNYRHTLFHLGGANETIVMPWRERTFSVIRQEELWHRFSTKEYPNMPPRRMKVSPALANYLRENKYNDKDVWIQRLGLNESIDFETQYFTPSVYFTEEHGIFAAEPATLSHGGSFREVPIYGEKEEYRPLAYTKNIMAMIPEAREDLETSSIFSAFVIGVVCRYVAKMKNYHELSPDKKELVLTYALLRAQEAAYYTVTTATEFSEDNMRNEEANSLISDVVIEGGSDSILKGTKFRSAQNVTKIGGDRVTTMFTVSSSLEHEGVFSVAMSRLHKSFNDSNDDSWAYPHFVEKNAEGESKPSRPFTSMADVLLYRKRYDNTTMLFSFVSVSGSIRTVEAAASVSVRMLIEEKTPAEAIRSPAALYDPRDNKCYCEHDQKFRERLYKKYKIVCEEMKTGDKEMQDRVVMAMKIQEKNVGYSDTIMTTSVSRQPMEYNYPVGF